MPTKGVNEGRWRRRRLRRLSRVQETLLRSSRQSAERQTFRRRPGDRANANRKNRKQPVERYAVNNPELRANVPNILIMIHECRPKYTVSSYWPKQEEFREFCRRKEYSDDLYRTQKALGINCNPSARENNVGEYLKALQRRDARRDKVNYADKGWKETLLDGYTEQEFERVCRELWARGAGSPECHFRALVDLLLGHYMLARGGDRRNAELSNLLTFEFTGDGLTRCRTNTVAWRRLAPYEIGGPHICLLSGLAFYLLCH
ncbi:hypothetical protein P885DRAFT_64040 [Corynascus similis CBS 632.67]